MLHTSFKTRARIGHVRRGCPQRQGSQDFGTVKSQLAIVRVRGTSFSFEVLYKHSQQHR